MKINCTKCGAGVPVEEGATFAQCGYCDISLFIDRSKVVFHFWVQPTIDMAGAHRNLRRWMAGNDTVEGLDSKAVTNRQTFFYFPFWRFMFEEGDEENYYLEPAAPTTIYELKKLEIPAGSMIYFNRGKIKKPEEFREVEINSDAALQKLEEREINVRKIKQISLVHIPVYRFAYSYADCEYTALVEGATGEVFAGVYPEKSDVPYTAVTLATIFIFFVEGLMIQSFPIRFIVMFLTAFPLAFGAYKIIRKY